MPWGRQTDVATEHRKFLELENTRDVTPKAGEKWGDRLANSVAPTEVGKWHARHSYPKRKNIRKRKT